MVCGLILMTTNASSLTVMCSGSCDIFHFWEITDNISEVIKDRAVVTVED